MFFVFLIFFIFIHVLTLTIFVKQWQVQIVTDDLSNDFGGFLFVYLIFDIFYIRVLRNKLSQEFYGKNAGMLQSSSLLIMYLFP